MEESFDTSSIDNLNILERAYEIYHNDVFNKIENINNVQNDVYIRLNLLLRSIDEINDIIASNNNNIKASKYAAKIQNIKCKFLLFFIFIAIYTSHIYIVAVTQITSRLNKLKNRVNNVREICPPQQALVEKGPFTFVCTYKGGVRYRDYPSSSSSMTGEVCEYDEKVIVKERIYITG